MHRLSPAPGSMHFQGSISLERALFCVGCEVIFTGAARCPYCSGEAVWPLSGWLRSTRPFLAGLPSRLTSTAAATTDQKPPALLAP